MNNERTGPRKRARAMTKTSKSFYLKFMIGVMAIETYFAYQYFSIKDFSSSNSVIV
jgi:hypothetical protein